MTERKVSSERVSEERLLEMLDGLDGVTPGPWDVMRQNLRAGDRSGHWSVPLQVGKKPNGGNTFAEVYMGGPAATHNSAAEVSALAEHIARCDPDTMRAIISELLALRSSVKTVGDAAFEAVLNCPHVIEGARVVLKADYEKPGNALAQLHARLSALEAPTPQGALSEVTEQQVELAARAIVSSLWDDEGGGVIAVDLWQSKQECVDAKWQNWAPEARAALTDALQGDRP
jgi:hypothetical protein